MNDRADLIAIIAEAVEEHGAYALDEAEVDTLAAGIADSIIAIGWPRRPGYDNVGEYVVEMSVAGIRRFVITAKGLEALGLYSLADRARRESRARLEARGLVESESDRERMRPVRDDYDAPAGAGHDVEADRG